MCPIFALVITNSFITAISNFQLDFGDKLLIVIDNLAEK